MSFTDLPFIVKVVAVVYGIEAFFILVFVVLVVLAYLSEQSGD